MDVSHQFADRTIRWKDNSLTRWQSRNSVDKCEWNVLIEPAQAWLSPQYSGDAHH